MTDIGPYPDENTTQERPRVPQYGPGNPPPEQDDFACCRNGEHKPAEQLRMDLLMYGNAYIVDGKRVPPESVVAYQETKGYPLHATQAQQDDLAEEISGLLEEAMHLEACWISEDETRCQCIIAKLQDALPRCGHVERIGTKGLTRQCLSTVHPSAPYKHTFGTV
jgi:hypothetical protein